MSLSEKYLFNFNGNQMLGDVKAYNGDIPVEPERMIYYLRECDKSKITAVVSAQGFPCDDTNKCKVYMILSGEEINITIEDRKTPTILFSYNGIIQNGKLIKK